MSLHLTTYLIPLLLTAAVSLACAWLVWRRSDVSGSIFLGLLMLAVADWSFSYAMQLSSNSLVAKLAWSSLESIGIALVPALWLTFILQYTGREGLVRLRYLLPVFLVPALTIVLAWTNPLHHLVWAHSGIVPGSNPSVLQITYGPWFWVNLTYAYILAFISVMLSLQALHFSLRLYRTQALALLFGSLVPWLAHIFYLSGTSPFDDFNLTPIAFAFSGIVIVWGLYRYHLTDIIPIARASIVEGMEEGVIVVNRRGQVADLNPAAEHILGGSATQLVGIPVTAVLPGWQPESAGLDQPQLAYTEVELRQGGQRQVYGVQVNRLDGRNEPFKGQLIVLRNVTEKHRQEEQIQQLNQMLKMLNAGSQVVARAALEEDVIAEVCRLLVRQGGYQMAWLGYLNPDTPGQVQSKAWAGVEPDCLPPEAPAANFPGEELALRAIQSGQAAIDRQMIARPDQPCAELLSAISMPLSTEGQAFGALTIFSREPERFQPQEVRLLVELVDNLAYGIRLLRSREEARSVGEALHESELKYRTLFDASADSILVETLDGRILDVNSAACSLFGYRREEITTLHVTDLIPAEVLESLPDLISEPLTGSGMMMEALARKKNEQVFQARINTQVAVIDGEQVLIVYVRDITTQKAVEEQMRQNADHARTLAHVAARLNARLDLSVVLKAVCEATVQALDISVAILTLYEPDGKETVSQVAEYGLPEQYQKSLGKLAGILKTDLMVDEGNIQWTPDLQMEPAVTANPLLHEMGVHTCIRMVLQRNNEAIGVLTGYTIGEPHHFTLDEIDLFHGLGDQAVQAIVNARLYEETQRRLSQVQALHAIDLEIAESMDLFVTLHVLLVHITEQLNVDSAAILLFEEGQSRMEFAAGCGFRTRMVERSLLAQSQSFANQAALERETVYAPQLFQGDAEQVRPLKISRSGDVTLVVAPLISKGEVKGVLEVYCYEEFDPDPEWMEFLESFASLSAITIDNAQLFNDLQNKNVELEVAYNATIEGWSRALELRDKETQGHTDRVAELTLRLARAMGISEAELVHIHRGALLHDIGKMAIPDAILLKPGDLTEDEWKIMKRHPVIAYELLYPIAYLRPALDIPYNHHEKWDGSGYPRGLRGEDIPLAARIFSVVDVWDALTSQRPYRADWSYRDAYEYIRDQAGAYFDPAVARTFLKFMEESGDLGNLDVSKIRKSSILR